jgi:hypothetical protein
LSLPSWRVVVLFRLLLSKSLGRLYDPGGGEAVLLARLVLKPNPKEVLLFEWVFGRA